MQVTKENWLPIAGYEGKYEISDWGRVKSLARPVGTKGVSGFYNLPETIKITGKNSRGYPNVSISKEAKSKTLSIHRIVAKHFVVNPSPETYDTVNHIDGNKGNNHYLNLEWCTQSQNALHAYRELGHIAPMTGVNNHPLLSKPVIQMDMYGNEINRFPSFKETLRAGFNNSHVSSCCSGKRKTHKGYTWKYA